MHHDRRMPVDIPSDVPPFSRLASSGGPIIATLNRMNANDLSFNRLLLYPLHARGLDVGEPGQCRLRVLAAAAVFLLYLAAHASGFFPDLTIAIQCVGAYLLFSYLWSWVVALEVGRKPVRLVVCNLLEYALFAFVFVQGGSAMCPLIWVAISTTLGYGLRFGYRHGIFSAVAGSAMLAAAMALSPFWRASPSVACGIVMAVLVVPLYAFGLNHRIQRARIEAEERSIDLLEAARIDPLTGLLNRVGLEGAVRAACQTARADGSLNALLFIDLDDFKSVNDTAGHAAGDAVLKEVAKRMRNAVRSGDVVARFGGDEFVIVLDALKDADDAARIAGTVLSGIQDVRVAGHPGLSISASIGVSMLLPETTSADAISAADERMLAGKRRGKGRVDAGDSALIDRQKTPFIVSRPLSSMVPE